MKALRELLCVATMLAVVGGDAGATLSYDVSIASASPPIMQVDLRYAPTQDASGPLELVFPRSPGTRGRMLSPYCMVVAATGPAGEPLDATLAYEIDGVRIYAPQTPLTLSYSVLLVHGLSPYSGMSPAESAVLTASGGVFPPRVLLMLPAGTENPPIALRVHAPRGWNVVAPWEMKRTGGAYETMLSYRDAIDSFFYIGAETGVTSRLGRGELTVVAPADLPAASGEELQSWTRRMMEGLERAFGRAPASRILVCLSAPPVATGLYTAARRDSAHLVLPPLDSRAAASRPQLLRGMARGLVHLWVGGMSAMPADATLFYFESGLAEYTATRCLARAGLLSEEEFLDYLNAMLEEYLNNPLAWDVPPLEGARTPELADAPEALKQLANLLAHNAGNLAGFLLEEGLLSSSGHDRDLDAFWAMHLSKFGRQATYGREEYLALWGELSPKVDLLAPLAQAPLPVEPSFLRAGVRVVASTLDEPFMGAWFDSRSATAEVKAVMPGPARRAGLSRGDVIVRVRAMNIPDANVLFFQLENARPGEVLPMRIRRPDGEEREIQLQLEARTIRTLEKVERPTAEQARLWRALVSR